MDSSYTDSVNNIQDNRARNFALRLSQLRTQAGISAREMSTDLGRNHTYINTIENARSYPTMDAFLEICDYLGTSPSEFLRCFDVDEKSKKRSILHDRIALLSNEQIDTVLNVVNAMVHRG